MISLSFRKCQFAIRYPAIVHRFILVWSLTFFTAHIVDTKDRNGWWHHAIRERKRYEGRIAALEHMLLPSLEGSHRNKILTSRGDKELIIVAR